jgi:hypothetical protein
MSFFHGVGRRSLPLPPPPDQAAGLAGGIQVFRYHGRLIRLPDSPEGYESQVILSIQEFCDEVDPQSWLLMGN